MRGDNREVLRDAAMRDRDARVGRDRDRAGDAGYDLERHAGPDAGQRFFAAAAEHERVAALEPDHALAGQRPGDDELVDLRLGQVVCVRLLARVDDLDVRVKLSQQ